MDKDDQKVRQNAQPEPTSRPFRGSEEIIKNLSTFPEGSGDKEDLLSQVVPEELNQQHNQPAQTNESSNESK